MLVWRTIQQDWGCDQQASTRLFLNCSNHRACQIQSEAEEIQRDLSEILWKRQMCPLETCQWFSIKTSPYKHQKKLLLFASSMEKWQVRCQIPLKRIQASTLLNLVLSEEKKFDVQQHFNSQNDQIWSGDNEPQTVTQRQGAASVMGLAALTATGKVLWFVCY